jgi:hypothetical protein
MGKESSLSRKLYIGLACIFLLFAIVSCEKEKSVTGPTASNKAETFVEDAAITKPCYENIPDNKQCVAYIKEQKPEYNFPWGGCAYLIWYNPRVAEKGGIPKVGSVMVLGPYGNNSCGHVGIVRSVDPIRGSGGHYSTNILIDHRNWNCDGNVLRNDSFTVYINTSLASFQEAYWNTVKYNKTGRSYPLLGFIYKLNKR